MNTHIVAAGAKEDIGCRVVLWDEPGGLSFLPRGKFSKHNASNIEQLRKVIKQFTVHYSITYRASHMLNGLNARGLSCNFMIDDDEKDGFATVYQNLDIVNAGWSQGSFKGKSFNGLGPGVELSYMPDAWQHPNRYSLKNQKRWDVPPHDIVTDKVHGVTFTKIFAPTEAQMKSLVALIAGFCRLFPDIPSKFPRDEDGNFIRTQLKDPHSYSGLVNHYHLRRGKVDTIGLDMNRIEKDVDHRLAFWYRT